MKRKGNSTNSMLFIVIVALFINACSVNKIPTYNKVVETKVAVNTLLTNWHKAAANADFEGYFNLMDSVSVFIGTDASENWSKNQFKLFSKPFFDKGKAWTFKALERNVYVNKSATFVWFDELLDTWMGTCRGSGVLEKHNNNWKIKQYVLSIQIPNDNVKMVINIKKKNDAIFLQKYK